MKPSGKKNGPHLMSYATQHQNTKIELTVYRKTHPLLLKTVKRIKTVEL